MLIPYPDVADPPGVPSISRKAAGTPSVSIALASAAQSLASAASEPPQWDIFEYTSAQPLGPALCMPENGILVEIFGVGADLLEQRPLAFNRGMTE